jgi:uncharacterized protein (DUF1330 family)
MRVSLIAIFVFLLAQSALAQSTAPAADERPGYLLVMGTATNAEVLGRYARTLPPIYQKFGGVYLAAGGVGRGITVLEGEFDAQSIIFARFPSFGGPNEFWWSPEYRASVEIRKGAGTFNVVKLAGLPGNASEIQGKPAYLISIAEITDRAKLKPYAESALPLVRAAGARFVSVGSRKDIELLEGNFGNVNVTVLQFPSLAALRIFYDDPAYQKIIPLRQSAGKYTVLAVDGFVPARPN